jgi:G3E family GTPase
VATLAPRPKRRGHHLHPAGLRWRGRIAYDRLQEALAALRAEAGDELVRLKGLVAIDKLDGPLLIQAVAGQAVEVAPLPAWPGGDEDSRLVVIAAGEDAGTPTRWLEHWRIYLGLADVASA